MVRDKQKTGIVGALGLVLALGMGACERPIALPSDESAVYSAGERLDSDGHQNGMSVLSDSTGGGGSRGGGFIGSGD